MTHVKVNVREVFNTYVLHFLLFLSVLIPHTSSFTLQSDMQSFVRKGCQEGVSGERRQELMKTTRSCAKVICPFRI